ncbi:MAG: zinc metallopeptidase [Clostridia bacterium]|nr:zinc metallopeptidase [Clostridia bacterium]
MYFFGIDYYYVILVLPAFLFALYAQFKVKSTFYKYSRIYTGRGISGADIARFILRNHGLEHVDVQYTPGSLTDHYDPRTRVVRLSEPVYHDSSVSALGVAAHETGHAIQHKVGYAPLTLRSKLVPIAGIGSSLGPYMALFGILFGMTYLTNIGILFFTGAVAFYLITLPVEFNASRRAVAILESTGFFSRDEMTPIKKVLKAAAMTYVASAAVAMASLLRLLLLANRSRQNS